MNLINIQVYDSPLTEGQGIIYNHTQSDNELSAIKLISADISNLVNETRNELGVSNIPPVALDNTKSSELKEAIKSQDVWKKQFNNLMEVSNVPTESRDEDAIYLPWWNASILHTSKDNYQNGSLSLDTSIAHSYLTQLMRRGKLSEFSTKPISLSSVILTSDNFTILGLRCGQNFANTIMSVPAGSIEYHTGINPLLESLYAEAKEEVGLSQQDITSAEVIGKVSGGIVEQNPHYVTRIQTSKSLAELLNLWATSIDYHEHKKLIAYPDDSRFVRNQIETNLFDFSKADPERLPSTTLDNAGTILPHCAATLIAHYIQKGDTSFNDLDRFGMHYER